MKFRYWLYDRHGNTKRHGMFTCKNPFEACYLCECLVDVNQCIGYEFIECSEKKSSAGTLEDYPKARSLYHVR